MLQEKNSLIQTAKVCCPLLVANGFSHQWFAAPFPLSHQSKSIRAPLRSKHRLNWLLNYHHRPVANHAKFGSWSLSFLQYMICAQRHHYTTKYDRPPCVLASGNPASSKEIKSLKSNGKPYCCGGLSTQAWSNQAIITPRPILSLCTQLISNASSNTVLP